jgi:hypothetical protein
LMRRLLSSTCFHFKVFYAHAAFPLPQVAKWVCAMLTNFRTMTVDRCHNRFVALFWFRCFGAQVISRLTSLQLEDVHERSTVHALAAGAT